MAQSLVKKEKSQNYTTTEQVAARQIPILINHQRQPPQDNNVTTWNFVVNQCRFK